MKFLDSFGNKRDNQIANAFQKLNRDMHYSFYDEIVKLFVYFGWSENINAETDEVYFHKNNIHVYAYCDYLSTHFCLSGEIMETCNIVPGKFWINHQETTQVECFALLLNWMRL